MSVLVTGGAGFIGANLCRRLLASGETVVVIDDLSTGSKENLDGVDVQFVESTILDRDALDDAMADVSAVVHLAARPSVPRSLVEPIASHHANATGTLEVLEAARRVGNPHVLIASSTSVYGANPVLPRREDLATFPMSPYAASKLATEAYGLAYQHSFDLPVLVLRFFNVFGPLQSAGHSYAAVVPLFLSAALEGRPLLVHGDGRQSRDFTFVDTVTEIIWDAIVRQVVHAEPVNLAFGTRTDILTLAHMIEDFVGAPLRIEHVAPRVGDVRHSQGDSSRLRELFPDIVPVDLEVALLATLDWFRTQGVGGRSGPVDPRRP
jgi:UDP-glucose 4-epimerase